MNPNIEMNMPKEYRLEGDTVGKSLSRLQEIVDTIPERLRKISLEQFSSKSGPDRWSKKQIVGHLIDSATNNHHRFIRSQFEDNPMIQYDQDRWNEAGLYDQMEKEHLISFWEMYNRHLIHLIRFMPEERLSGSSRISDGISRSVSWLFEDYVRHLDHHLHQIFEKSY